MDKRFGKIRRKDISGRRFGRLIVVKYASTSRHRQAIWLCRCDCGEHSQVATVNLTSGITTSCGCAQREAVSTHGLSHLREYRCWSAMMSRCFNPDSNRYESYAGRDITVCSEWQTFEGFLRGFGMMPEGDYTIERIDNNGNYEPANCRWATNKEQARNRRSTFYVTFNGKRCSLAEHAEDCGISYKTAWKRIRCYGWSPEQALTTSTNR